MYEKHYLVNILRDWTREEFMSVDTKVHAIPNNEYLFWLNSKINQIGHHDTYAYTSRITQENFVCCTQHWSSLTMRTHEHNKTIQHNAAVVKSKHIYRSTSLHMESHKSIQQLPDNSLWNVQEDGNTHGNYHDQQDLVPSKPNEYRQIDTYMDTLSNLNRFLTARLRSSCKDLMSHAIRAACKSQDTMQLQS